MPPKRNHKKEKPKKLDKHAANVLAMEELKEERARKAKEQQEAREKKRAEERAARDAREDNRTDEERRKHPRKKRQPYHKFSLEVQKLIVDFIDTRMNNFGETEEASLAALNQSFSQAFHINSTSSIQNWRVNVRGHAILVEKQLEKTSKKWSEEQVALFKKHLLLLEENGLLWTISTATLRLNLLAEKRQIPVPSRFMVHHWMKDLQLHRVMPRVAEEPINLSALRTLVQKRLSYAMWKAQTPTSCVFNLDESAFRIYPEVCRRWVREKHVPKTRDVHGSWVTTTWAVTMTGKCINPQVVWHGKTARCHDKRGSVRVTEAHSKNHWADEHTIKQYIEEVILPYRDRVAERREEEAVKKGEPFPTGPAIILWDHAPKHHSVSVLKYLMDYFQEKVIFIFVPKRCTPYLQPLDVGVFGPVKAHFKNYFQNEVVKLYEHKKLEVHAPIDHAAESKSHHKKPKPRLRESPRETIKSKFFQCFHDTVVYYAQGKNFEKNWKKCWKDAGLDEDVLSGDAILNAAKHDVRNGVPLYDLRIPSFGILRDNMKHPSFKPLFKEERIGSGRISGDKLSAPLTPAVTDEVLAGQPPANTAADAETQTGTHRPPRAGQMFECDSVTDSSDDEYDWEAQAYPSDEDYDPDLDSSMDSHVSDVEPEGQPEEPTVDP